MAREGVYVYGFVRAAEAPDLGRIGLEHAGAPARVYAIQEGRIAAVVSDHDARGRVMPIRRNLDRHDRAIREALQRDDPARDVRPRGARRSAGRGDAAAVTRRRSCASSIASTPRWRWPSA